MSTMTFEAGPSQMQTSPDGPRKRRKRAPAAGAADDCFTCSTRNTKCDRRRPYCTPCLDAGQDCAGYKTQLTWGVGVASRGKLRGLSLPVAGTKKVTEPVPAVKRKRVPQPPVSTAPIQFASNKNSAPLSPDGTNPNFAGHQLQLQNLGTVYHNERPQYRSRHYSFAGSISNESQPEVLPSPTSSMATSPPGIGWMNGGSLPHQHTFTGTSPISPIAYSAPSQTGHYFDAIPGRGDSYQQTMDSYPSLSSVINPVYPMENSYSSYQSQPESYDSSVDYMTPTSNMANSMQSARITPMPEEEIEEIYRQDPAADALSASSGHLLFDMSLNFSPFSGVNSVGKTPRMQYLIQYYAEVIAPVIVAFDSPTNPFRNQILTLAAKSESLQHALSALAASNLRQRKESGTLSTGKTLPARRSSQAHMTLTNEAFYSAAILPPKEQKREETYHKYQAVQSLNAALANHSLRKDDAVLATLLILCMFHICDSGIARFQTQFAGVKKLLAVRRQSMGAEDIRARWMTRIFTWFDAMAATVNEREGQFDSHTLEMSSTSDGEWSYETLAGIDGRLVKIMSHLGRLNLLSQGQSVDENPTLVSRPPPFMMTPPNSTPSDFGAFDGNGWMRMVDDEQFFMSKTGMQGSSTGGELHQADNEQFWREWRELRQQLQTWNLDNLLYESMNHPEAPHLTDEQRVDVDNISNAFRYSALLYTERLASPRLPSADEKIQYWVRRSLHHIKRVRSDVYLLWPLFITGSECVHEEGRNVIRERCLDIQKDSGFVNNASCLALLEKVWSVVPAIPVGGGFKAYQPRSAGQPQFHQPFTDMMPSDYLDGHVNGFRFRDVMKSEGNEGEWIVV